MSRGKRARSREAQARRALAAEIDQLRTEIAEETARAADVRVAAAQVEVAQRKLVDEQRATHRRLKPYVTEAQRRAQGAIRTRPELVKVLREVREVDDTLGGGVADPDSVELAAQAGIRPTLTDVHPSASSEFRQVWYRKKAGRALQETRELSLHGWIPDHVEHDQSVYARYARSRPVDTTPEACWTWAIPPWMRIPADTSDAPTLRKQFGATGTGAPTQPTSDYPGPPLRRDALIVAPWRHAPLVGHPADALDLAYWYRRSTWIQGWDRDSEPVPMWLPSEHAADFPAGRELPADVDVRLPFPTVFAALASSWRIEPNPDYPHQLLSQQPLFFFARGRLGDDLDPPRLEDVLGRLQATGLTHRDDLPSPLEFLDGYGGYVEAVILTADQHGVPGDDIAWCVAIYHPNGLPLARIAIPASRTQSAWRAELDKLTAGIALASWHEATTLPARLTGPRPPAAEHAITEAEGLRVLDIDATSPRPEPTTNEPTGATVRPHRRRGHWRHQPVGTGRQQRRWTWVRNTDVHGGSATNHHVYVLRDRTA